jgi:polysaccharide pyruvyl transferase WcaK-like protein
MERMMNVGILSMQKIKNYGSFLQSFALKKTIEYYGHVCEFIDIEQGRQLSGYERNMAYLLRKASERFIRLHFIKHIKSHYQFNRKFDDFFNILEADKHGITFYDLVIIGSDEVFNFAQYSPWGFTAQLFGNIPKAKKIISYAGSFGSTTMDIINKYQLHDEIATSLKKLSAISVRDENSRNIIQNLLSITSASSYASMVHIDPVLFFDFDKYIKPIQDRSFILIYSYPGRMKDKEEINAIKQIAKKHNKSLISIGFFYDWCDKTVIPDPFEVLSYFIYAEYIITDTFHGALLSLKYNKQFVVFIRHSNKNKLHFLLSSMSLEDRIIVDIGKMENMLKEKIDYTITNKIISDETSKAYRYLEDNLNNA